MAKHRYVTRAGRSVEHEDGFRETLAPTMPAYDAREVNADESVAYESERSQPLAGIEMVIGWLAGAVALALAIRFAMSLLAIDRSSTFANFIYGTTGGLVSPFTGLLRYSPTSGLGYFDLPALAALVATALLAWLLTSILRIGRR